MQIKRLSHDDLAYKMKIRGIALGTVDSMRNTLAMTMRLEKSGDTISFPEYSFSAKEDMQAVKPKLNELGQSVEIFSNV